MTKRVVLWVILVLGGLFFYRIRAVLVPFAIAALMVFLAAPLVKRIEGRDVPKTAAIMLTYAIFTVIVTFALLFIVPRVIVELNEVLGALPKQTEKLEDLTKDAGRVLQDGRLPSPIRDFISRAADRGREFLERFATRIVELTIALLSQFLNILLAPVLAFYMLRDWGFFRDQILALIPDKHRDGANNVGREICTALSGFIRGQLIVSMFVGTLIALGLTFLKVRFAFLIGIMAGLFDIVPYFGPFIGATPAVLLAFVDSPLKPVWVLILFVVVNQIEGAIISPHVMSNAVGLHPLLVIFAILAGGQLMGILGMLLAVPVTATLKVVLRHVLIWIREPGSSGVC